jgi:uncharacterized protein YcbX
MSPTIGQIDIYPVKSCRPHRVESAVVSRYGLQGDREWQVQAPDGQGVAQTQFPQLARLCAVPISDGLRLEYEGMPDLEVARPDRVDCEGDTYFSGHVPLADAGEEAADWLEQILGAPCRLTAMGQGYQRRILLGDDLRGVGQDCLERDVFGQDVSLVDLAPIHIVNAASHRFLLERAAEPFEIERFRANVVVDGFEPWDEDTWHRISTGAVDIDVVMPWPRCAIPQIDQRTGLRHREPAVVLKRYRWCRETPSTSEFVRELLVGNALFGVGASVRPEGSIIAVGDPLEVSMSRQPLGILSTQM